MSEQLNQDGNVANDGRRFSLVVQNVSGTLDLSGTILIGDIHGTIRKGDAVYILVPGGKTILSEVIGIEVILDGSNTEVREETTDSTVYLHIDLKDPSQILKYSVVTSVRPQQKVDVKQKVENPVTSALLYEVKKLKDVKAFYNYLMANIVNGFFITPMKLEGEPVDNGDGTATFKKDTKMGFYMIKADPSKKEIPEKGGFLLPVFTDWYELSKWKQLSESNEKVKTMIVRFNDCVAISNSPQFAGFVVNPFSKNNMVLSKQLIASIMNSPGYKQANSKTPNVGEQKIPAGTQIALGVPAESEEVTNIREALKKYGQSHDEITSIDFMIKLSEDKKAKYLINLGVDKEIAKEHMQAIYEAIREYTVAVKEIEFSIKGQVKAIDDIAEKNKEKMLVYEA